MREMDEDSVRMAWMRASELTEEASLAMTKRFVAEQAVLFRWFMPEEPTQFDEVLLQLTMITWQIVSQRDGGKPRPVAPIDLALLERLMKKRQATIGDFMAGKQAQAMGFIEALETLSDKVEYPQWALLGHLTEAIIDLLESEEWTRSQAESAFVRLTVLVDAFDRVVKS